MKIQQVDMLGVGFDCIDRLTPETAQCLVKKGFGLALRDCAGVTDDEFFQDVENCLKVGLVVGIYQGSYWKMWYDQSLACQRAIQAVHKAHIVQYPVGGTIWLNVEDIPQDGHQAVIEWINEWSKVVRDYYYGAGVYCGINTLSGDEYYSLPFVTHYWKNCSTSSDIVIPERGYQVYQHYCDVQECGVTIDIDIFMKDRKGQAPCGMKLEE